MNEFGNTLREIRMEKGYTLDQMAELLGATKQALSRYENGKRTPKITVAAKFAEKLGVPLEQMMGYEYHAEEPAEYYLRVMTEKYELELTTFAELFVNMTPRKRKMAMRILQSIADEDEE